MGHLFGARLRELRTARGVLQRDLEEALSLRMGTASQYERGLREPGFDLLLAMADYFDVSVDYLLGRPSAPQESPLLVAGRLALQEALKKQGKGLLLLRHSERFSRVLKVAQVVAPEIFTTVRLARRCGVPVAVVQQCLSGTGTMGLEAIMVLADYMGLPPEWFCQR